MKKINCIGDYCPIPLLKLQDELKTLQSMNDLLLVTDHSCVLESIRDYLSTTKYSYEINEVLNGVWEITITKNS